MHLAALFRHQAGLQALRQGGDALLASERQLQLDHTRRLGLQRRRQHQRSLCDVRRRVLAHTPSIERVLSHLQLRVALQGQPDEGAQGEQPEAFAQAFLPSLPHDQDYELYEEFIRRSTYRRPKKSSNSTLAPTVTTT